MQPGKICATFPVAAISHTTDSDPKRPMDPHASPMGRPWTLHGLFMGSARALHGSPMGWPWARPMKCPSWTLPARISPPHINLELSHLHTNLENFHQLQPSTYRAGLGLGLRLRLALALGSIV
ncbi:unnamed protein product [Ectocarpus sp. 8 AP-2014]